MTNQNPLPARQAKKSRRQRQKPGDLDALRVKLWHLIDRLDDHLADAQIAADTLKAGHLLIQTSGVYLKLIEVGEIEARLTSLEGMR